METCLTCPLGAKCEEIKDNILHRCIWYVEMKGTDSAGDEHNEWNCAMAWMPILQTEVATSNRGVAASIESMRNEMTEGQKRFNTILEEASKKRLSNEN